MDEVFYDEFEEFEKDVYSEEGIECLVEDDEISNREFGFMSGYLEDAV